MAKNLVIVESPAKANTIKNYLGKDFEVKSSFGHVRDLPKNKIGVVIEKNYKPEYEVSPDKKKLVKELKDLTQKAETVWLATDEDREGEAIAWHLYEVLGLSKKDCKRITFHEITKNAIQKAVETPREIDYDLVNAQQARRILDRLVGYELSELLWKKVKGAMSAGRVQSVAVKLVVEREEEINNFKTESFYKISALFEFTNKENKKAQLKAEIASKIDSEKKALEILEKFMTSFFEVSDIKQKDSIRKPSAPFTTSTLQQEANRKLGYSVSRTMQLAQSLYEAGKITYMRTDSTNLSDDALGKCKSFITNNFGENYLKIRQYKTKTKNAQEAHEAIRPTEMKLNVTGESAEQKLYELIFYRTLASQMADAVFEKTTITIKASNVEQNLSSSAEIIKFDGFLKIYNFTDLDNEDEAEQIIPALTVGQKLTLIKANALQKYTNPPYRFNEASIVSKLEELGIGRPSTYASIISTIIKHKYVEKAEIKGSEVPVKEYELKGNNITKKEKTDFLGKEKNKFKPTDVGVIVTGFLNEHFKNIVDFNFTAKVEEDFDDIANGEKEWQKIIDIFYKDFHGNISHTLETADKVTGERFLGIEPESGKKIFVKLAKYGPVVQLGEVSDDDKPEFVSLGKELSLGTVTLEQALELIHSDKNGRYLGDDPKTGKPIYARIAKFGPVLQIGTYQGKDKPSFVKMLKNQSVETITYEEALKMTTLPRDLGKFEGKNVTADIGRFGPYVKHDNKFIAMKKTDHPLEITLQRAIELIEEKRKKDEDKLIKNFSDDLKIIKDRWGRPTIFYKKKYFKIPKETDASQMTEADCMKIIKSETKK